MMEDRRTLADLSVRIRLTTEWPKICSRLFQRPAFADRGRPALLGVEISGSCRLPDLAGGISEGSPRPSLGISFSPE